MKELKIDFEKNDKFNKRITVEETPLVFPRLSISPGVIIRKIIPMSGLENSTPYHV